MSTAVAEATEPTAGVEETQPTAQAPESPEATSPPATAGDEPAPTGKEPTASDRPRDANGRFLKQDKAAPTDGAVAETAQTPPVDEIAPPPAPTTPSGEPFTFRAGGQRIPIQGATLSPEGALSIPPDQVPQVRQLLSDAVAFRTTWRQEKQRYEAQLKEAGSHGEARAEKYNKASVLLWDRLSQLLAEHPTELEMLKREVALTLREADLAIPAAKAPARTTEVPQQQEPQAPEITEDQARAVLQEEIEDLLDGPIARTLFTPQEREAVVKRYGRRLNAYFTEHEGEIVLDRQILKEDFEDELNARKQAREAHLKLEKASQFNQKRDVTPPPAPVISTKGPSSAAGNPTPPQSREEWRRRNGLN